MISVSEQGNTLVPYADREIPLLPPGSHLVFDPSQKEQVFDSLSELRHIIDRKLHAVNVRLDLARKVIDSKIDIDKLHGREKSRLNGLKEASLYVNEVFDGLRKFISEIWHATEYKKASSEFTEGSGI